MGVGPDGMGVFGAKDGGLLSNHLLQQLQAFFPAAEANHVDATLGVGEPNFGIVPAEERLKHGNEAIGMIQSFPVAASGVQRACQFGFDFTQENTSILFRGDFDQLGEGGLCFCESVLLEFQVAREFLGAHGFGGEHLNLQGIRVTGSEGGASFCEPALAVVDGLIVAFGIE